MNTRCLAAFEASFPPDAEFQNPEGCHFARMLQKHLPPAIESAGDFDNWRDIGWFVPCKVNGNRLWVCFARYSEPEPWQLIVEPMGMPGPLAWLFGQRNASCLPALRQLSTEVDRVLKSEPGVTSVRWALNSDPRRSNVADPGSLPWPESST